jgi:hypothetical protein
MQHLQALHSCLCLQHPQDVMPRLLVLQVQLLLSSGAASVWQASSPAVQQLLQQQQPTAAAKALAELASSAVPIRDLAKALQQQLEGLATAAAGPAAAPPTQRCSVGAWSAMFAVGAAVALVLLLGTATAGQHQHAVTTLHAWASCAWPASPAS